MIKNPSNLTMTKLSVCFGDITGLHTGDLAWKLSSLQHFPGGWCLCPFSGEESVWLPAP